MSREGNQGDANSGLVAWDGRRVLRSVSPMEVKLSRGFLRCRPEKWFPGLSGHWLPLIHSLGIELKVQEIRPALTLPAGLSEGFCGTIDDEPFALLSDTESVRALTTSVGGSMVPAAGTTLLEYLARRLITSLALSWSGPESSVVRFDTEIDPSSVQAVAALKLGLLVNGSIIQVWFALGKLAAERLDGLWKRQLRANARISERPLEVHLELTQLAVPPSMLAEYTRSSAMIDLELSIRDSVVLRLGSGAGSKAWSNARLLNVNGRLGVEMVPGPVVTPALPDGTTRLAISLGSLQIDSGMASELSQGGAQLETSIQIGDRVSMTLNSEKVAEAVLCTYEGRFAVSVV